MTQRSSRLRLLAFERRLAPAVLLHSLYPDTIGPQQLAQFGFATAASENYRVVAAPYADVSNLADVGEAYVYDAFGVFLHTIKNPEPEANDEFGYSVATAGKYVVIGNDFDDAGAINAGSAYVYDLTSMTPTVPVHILRNPTPATNDSFGLSVAVSGNVVVVGAAFDGTGASSAGSAYVYDLTSMTPTVPIHTLNNPAPTASDLFGAAVATSGNRILIGAYQDDAGASNAGIAYVYDLTSMTPTVPVHILNNPTPAVGDSFGIAVALSGSVAVVTAHQDDTGATNAGSAYAYDLSSMTPTVPAYTLNNPAPAASDFFGGAVAVAGHLVVVGAASDDAGAMNAGSTYVYDLSSPLPITPAYTLNKPFAAGSDFFGFAVGVAGSFVVVGVYGDDTGNTETGSAYVYDVSTITPTEPVYTLKNATPPSADQFGMGVAVSGNIVVVGAHRDDTGAFDAGSVYVYSIASATPTVPIYTLNNPTPAASDFFGFAAVAVSGNIIVVGAPNDDTGASNAGSAYVYDLNSMTPTVPIYTLNNPTPAGGDQFGGAVAVSGSIVVVGAISDDTGASDAGSAYVYDLNSPMPTVPIHTLNNPAPATLDVFGNSVAVAGKFVVVGAPFDDVGMNDAGSAYVYDLTSPTPTTPIHTFNNPAPALSDNFGWSTAVSGNKVVISAYRDDAGVFDAGSAYVYDLTSPTPTVPVHTLNNPTPQSDDRFGFWVAVSGNTLVVGAYQDNTGASKAGSVYIYDLNSVTPTVPSATLNNPTPEASDQFGYSVAVSGNIVVAGAWSDDSQNSTQGASYVYTIAPARVANVLINAGTAQRSRVTSLAVTFDQPVNFVGLPPDAFQLKRQSDDALVTLDAAVNGTTVTLTFIGGAVDFGSLADGRYSLSILSSKVSNTNGQLDGNGDGTPGDDYVLIGTPANGLFRLFGDADGNGTVNTADFNAFRTAFGGSSSIFDFDNAGGVGTADFNQFRTRFGSSV